VRLAELFADGTGLPLLTGAVPVLGNWIPVRESSGVLTGEVTSGIV